MLTFCVFHRIFMLFMDFLEIISYIVPIKLVVFIINPNLMKKVTILGLTLILALTMINTAYSQEIQRVRIDFTTPNGYVRHLLLGFTPDNSANDDYNYGYDALNIDEFADDLNWIVEDKRCVIQGVGAFEDTKSYPFGLYIKNPGTFKIELDGLWYFDKEIDVFVYDSLNDSYSKINDTYFENTAEAGDFEDRYYIAFKDLNANDSTVLSTEEINDDKKSIKYLRASGELFFNSTLVNNVKQLTVYNIFGQQIINQSQIKSNRIKLNLNSAKSDVYIVHLKTTNGIISKKIII